jgi:hypothetical protein
VVTLSLTLVAYGCPRPASVAAFGIDERTLGAWLEKAGLQAQAVPETEIGTGQLELGQVQGDEFYTNTPCGSVWIATAMGVFSRLLRWGAVSVERNRSLLTQVVEQVKATAVIQRPLLWATAGFSA